jgi:uncharacterized protein
MDLDAKVTFLRCPDSYPGDVSRVEAIETHMAWVFLAGGDAWKLKKPVHKPYLDFRTLAARERTCRAEVRLNRRLAPNVYRGIVPLTVARTGRLRLGPPGRTVDWLVRMRRLPRVHMLDSLIARGTVPPGRLDRVGRRLVEFYGSARRVRPSPDTWRGRIEEEILLDRATLLRPEHRLPAARICQVADALLEWLAAEPELITDRTGHIVEGHGDLRPEHICLEPEPVIIDCLEFSRTLREVDPVDELSFLALECTRLGAPGVGRRLLRQYRQRSGDRFPPRLVRFYTAFRALLRGRLAIEHTGDHRPLLGDRWGARTRAYLRLAALTVPQGAM